MHNFTELVALTQQHQELYTSGILMTPELRLQHSKPEMLSEGEAALVTASPRCAQAACPKKCFSVRATEEKLFISASSSQVFQVRFCTYSKGLNTFLRSWLPSFSTCVTIETCKKMSIKSYRSTDMTKRCVAWTISCSSCIKQAERSGYWGAR
jgi:hypothetical protein